MMRVIALMLTGLCCRLPALPKTSNILINQQPAYTLNTCVCVCVRVCVCMYTCVLKLFVIVRVRERAR